MALSKIKHWLSVKKVFAMIGLSLVVFMRLQGMSFAAESINSTVTQSYNSDEVLQYGLIVALDEGDTSRVHPAKLEEISKIHGVVVANNEAPVTLSREGEQAFVSTTGRYQVLVSNENGPINVGDYITLSSVQGIGMRGDEKYNEIVMGKALGAFDGQKEVLSKASFKESGAEVSIGRIYVDVVISKNPLLKGEEPNLPAFLKKATELVAGKPVDALRAYISLAIFTATVLISGSLLYGGVRSSMISIGRNPLSKKSIVRGLMQIIVVALIVLLCGIFGVYLLLRL